MQIKLRFERRGGHIHCDWFMAKGLGYTWENCGTIVVRDYEWEAFQLRLAKADISFEERVPA